MVFLKQVMEYGIKNKYKFNQYHHESLLIIMDVLYKK
jgi:hypothetical protein